MKIYKQKIETDPVLARSRYGVGDALMMERIKPENIPEDLMLEIRPSELYRHIRHELEASVSHTATLPHRAA